MKAKQAKIIATIILIIVSAISLNLFAFAEPDDEFDFVIDDITQEETEDIVVDEEEITLEVETEEETEKPTSAKKPTTTRRVTTTRNYYNNYNNYTPDVDTDSDNNEETPTQSEEFAFNIKLELNNGEEAVEVGVDEDGLVEIPEAPKKDGFKFDGWYSDEELTEKWDFLTSVATEETILYAKWAEVADDSLYTISVSTNLGGVITVTPEKAKAGEKVVITVTPDKGNQLVENSLSVNGKFIESYTFEMPANNVIVEAQFESVNADDVAANNKKLTDSIGKMVTIGAIVVLALGAIIWLIVNRYRFMPDKEEDELFFVEPMTNQPAIRHDDFVRNKRNQMNEQNKVENPAADADGIDIDIMNEAEIRKINKTGTINLDQ